MGYKGACICQSSPNHGTKILFRLLRESNRSALFSMEPLRKFPVETLVPEWVSKVRRVDGGESSPSSCKIEGPANRVYRIKI